MTTDINDPELCAKRAADPEWQAEQAVKNAAAEKKFADWREEVNLPLVRKASGERF